jgi:putative ABC transport system permease protein
MPDLFRPLAHALRSLRRTPGFAAACVLTLALGIAANTAIFSVVNRLLLDPLPFQGGARMGTLWMADRSAGLSVSPTAGLAEAFRRRARSLDGVEPYDSRDALLDGGAETAMVPQVKVAPTMLSFLGLRPVVGRMFGPDEVQGGGVALLGYGAWKTRFGGRPDVVGRTVRIDGVPHTIVGVMPARIDAADLAGGGKQGEVWTPFRPAPDTGHAAERISVLARLRPGVDQKAAVRELDAIAATVARAAPIPGRKWSIDLMRPQQMLGDGVRLALRVLMGVVALVLLIACANVAHLSLARAAGRSREMAVHVSMGATRGSLVRQLLTESLVLSALGGALGLGMAWWGVQALLTLRPRSLTALDHVTLDTPVLLFTAGVSAAAAVLFGIVPALRASRADPATVLRGTPGSGGSPGDARFRRGLLVMEVGVSLVLMVAAGLLLRSLGRMQAEDPGFRPDGVVAMRVALPAARYPTPAAREAFRDELIERARHLPGVVSAAAARTVPPDFGIIFSPVQAEGGPPDAFAGALFSANWVGSPYFATLGIALRAGRGFTEEEVRHDAPVMVVGEGLARKLAPRGSAVGMRVRFDPGSPWQTVVGVAADVGGRRTGEVGRLQMYAPAAPGMTFEGEVALVARTSGDAAALAGALSGLVRGSASGAAVREVEPLRVRVDRLHADTRFEGTLLSVFAGLAVLLAAIGLFAVLSYAVQQRTRELGIRIALGATPGRVRGLVVRDGLAPVSLGIVLGLGASLLATKAIAALLYGVQPRDAATFAASAVLLSAVGLAATLLPARRATRVDPAVALRAE